MTGQNRFAEPFCLANQNRDGEQACYGGQQNKRKDYRATSVFQFSGLNAGPGISEYNSDPGKENEALGKSVPG